MPTPAEAYDDDEENKDVLHPIPENAAPEHLMEVSQFQSLSSLTLH